jgi:uncharacterized damage-inducible protein DinB
MDPVIEPWLELWDYLDGNFWSVCRWAKANLSPDQVAWQPNSAVASIGWNLQHLGEMLDHYLAHVFLQGPTIQKSPLVTMQSGSHDDGRFRDLDAIAVYHRQVRPAYRIWLAQLTAADFGRVIQGPPGQEITHAWAVGHIAEHESYHIGKCTLLRNLLPGS